MSLCIIPIKIILKRINKNYLKTFFMQIFNCTSKLFYYLINLILRKFLIVLNSIEKLTTFHQF